MKYFIKQLNSLASQVSVESALNPMLWLCVISIFPFCMSFYVELIIIKIVFILVGVIPWFTAIGGFIYLLIKNPAFLRSERYQLIAQLLGDKDHPPQINGSKEIALELMKNPLMIEDKSKDSRDE